MRTLLPLALLCTGCVTADIVDPSDRTYDDRIAIPDDVVLTTATDDRFRLPEGAPTLAAAPRIDERFTLPELEPLLEPEREIDARYQYLDGAPMLQVGRDPRVDGMPANLPTLQHVVPTFHEAYAKISAEVTGDGYLLARLDGQPMKCFDGELRFVCRTNAIDWSRSRLYGTARLQMQEAMRKGATAPGVIAITSGHWIPIAPNIKYHPDGVWVLAEGWVAEPGGAVSEGEFVRITDNGIMCIVAPCPHLTESQLYNDRSVAIDELDFEPSGLRQALIDRVVADTRKPDGVIVAGERYYECGPYAVATGRTVTAAYRRLAVKQY